MAEFFFFTGGAFYRGLYFRGSNGSVDWHWAEESKLHMRVFVARGDLMFVRNFSVRFPKWQ